MQVSIVVLLTLRSGPAALTPSARLLFWGTNAISAAILGLSILSRQHYARLRAPILVSARLFYNLLGPQLVWQLAAGVGGGSRAKGSWPGGWGHCCACWPPASSAASADAAAATPQPLPPAHATCLLS